MNEHERQTYTNPGPSDMEGCGCPVVLLIIGIIVLALTLEHVDMCLVKQRRKQHCIATEDFECFKVIRYVYKKWYDGQYIRNFYETDYVEEFVTIPSLVYAEPYGCYKRLDNEEWLHDGVIHSFRFKEDAKKYCMWCNDCDVTWCNHVVVRCIIPAGTRYYYGEYHWSDYKKPYLCFGSEKIYYDKIIF